MSTATNAFHLVKYAATMLTMTAMERLIAAMITALDLKGVFEKFNIGRS